MKPSKMKDTIYKWMEEIPKDWNICPLKNIIQNKKFAIVDGPFGTQLHADDYVDEGVPLIRVNDIKKNGSFSERGLVHISEKKFNELIRSSVYANDILLAKTGATIGKVCLFPKSLQKGLIASSVAKISIDETKACPSFVNYFLFSEIGQHQIVLTGIGSTRPSINLEDIRNIMISLPNNVSQQRSISEILYKKTEKIDSKLDRNQKLIELLKEKRQSLVNHAVTKGLDLSVPMKDSGVEWIGKIPAHWKIKSLKKIIEKGTSITYGIVQAGEHVENGIPYIRTGDMYYETFPREGYLKTSSEIDSKFKRSKVYEGNIVVAIRATVGKAMMVPDFLDGANLTQGTAKIAPNNEMNNKFVLHAINSESSQQRFNAIMKGATFKEITLEMLRNFVITCPPLNEQKEILDFIDKKTSKIDLLIHKTTSQIEKLKEFRQSLISSAVTGKIDVREAVA